MLTGIAAFCYYLYAADDCYHILADVPLYPADECYHILADVPLYPADECYHILADFPLHPMNNVRYEMIWNSNMLTLR